MRRKVLFGSLAAAALLGAPALSRAADLLFTGPTGPGGTYNVYRWVTAGTNWDQARFNSTQNLFNGMPGHLVTVNSMAEHNLISSATGGDRWIGLTDSAGTSTLDGANFGALGGHEALGDRSAGAGWVWVTGEPYADLGLWNGGEPNDWTQNGAPGEDAVHMSNGGNGWNDHQIGGTVNPVPNTDPLQTGSPNLPYIVEYETHLASAPMSQWSVKNYRGNAGISAITNYATADQLIGSPGLNAPGFPVSVDDIATDTTDTLTNGPNGTGHFNFNAQVPGLSPSVDNNDFVLVGTGTFGAVNAGTYTFRTTTDDGSRLRLSVNGGPLQQVVTDDVLSGPHDVTGTLALNAGDTVSYDWMWFERGGGATGELSYSPNGAEPYFLVGDDTGGLSPLTPVTLTTYKLNTSGSYTVDSLEKADAIRDAAHFVAERLSPTFNIVNTDTDGSIPGGLQPPGYDGATDQDNFAVYGTGFLKVVQEGDYQFGVLSDDGARLTIDGVGVIVDNTNHDDTSPFLATVHLTAGYHPIEMMFYELGGGASGELFLQDAAGNRVLVGDALNGGLQVVQQVPEPSTFVLGGLGLFGLALGWIRKKFKK